MKTFIALTLLLLSITVHAENPFYITATPHEDYMDVRIYCRTGCPARYEVWMSNDLVSWRKLGGVIGWTLYTPRPLQYGDPNLVEVLFIKPVNENRFFVIVPLP